jgi:chaperonin GroES
VQYIPLANRVIMREIQERKTTSGGLWVPDIARRNKGLTFAEVLAVGPGRYNADGRMIPVHVKVGDIVAVPRAAPAVLPLIDDDGNENVVLMCPENDIVATVIGLPRQTHIVGIDGAPLDLAPTSLALPDSVYENREGMDRTIADLKSVNAPPDVIEEMIAINQDEPR